MNISDVPVHKKILSTTYTVDCFKIEVEGCSHYFLSHFHADHYKGLTNKFPHEIYCSHTTSRLLLLKYKVKTRPLEMFKVYSLLNEDTVVCIDAHHCPGAVCFVFRIKGEYILHTGDFRSTPSFLSQISWKFTTVYLDNTFEGFRSFGSQREAIFRVIKTIQGLYSRPCLFPLKYTFLFGTYSVGKEKIFLSAAEFFDKGIRVTKEKKKIYDCYDEYTIKKLNLEVVEMVQSFKKEFSPIKAKGLLQIANMKLLSPQGLPFSRISTDTSENQFIVISTTQIDKKQIHKLLLGNKSDKIVVFCGTGWKDTIKYYDWLREDGRVVKKGIEVHYIPYSEHSSSEELALFKSVVSYERLINTVKKRPQYTDLPTIFKL